MVVALIALFAALGGGAYAALKLPKNSVGAAQIKKGAVTPTKLSPSTKAVLATKGPKGDTGATGVQGPKGDTGPRGDTGPQGPGATTLTYDAAASASPTQTIVGTVLGDTFSAECSIPSPGEVKLTVYVATSDGSLQWDVGTEASDNGVESGRATSIDFPAGTILSPTPVAGAAVSPGNSKSDHNSQIVALRPVRGYLNLHSGATITLSPAALTCHLSVMAFPSG
jgi:hypothetical protein